MINNFVSFFFRLVSGFVSVSLLLPGLALAQVPQYGEYIDLPGAVGAADPHVIEADGVWYLYPTSTGVSIECWSSTDLETWVYEGAAWGPATPGSWNDHGVWAPEIFEHEDSYYL